ncbi:MAG: twin-arginine translocation signal domain-containing protein [Verrucomicrobia bacterium]|nr:twin-arginine translocation signal domain-containing protein [Verrucomicrobiota bacterium]
MLSRRNFLKTGSLAGLAASVPGWMTNEAQADGTPFNADELARIPRAAGRGVMPVKPKFPNIGAFTTLLGDFHQHTVFSDGDLRPTARVVEAKKEGLDVICLSDHIEVRPFKNEIAHLELRRGFELAGPRAQAENIILVPGLEITRAEPYAKHLNALFLTDFEALIQEKLMDAVYAAAKQDAFIFWNHPAWGQKELKSTWYPEMDVLLREGILKGFEVVNGFEGDARDYQPDVMQWCQRYNVTMFGNSDCHTATAYMTNWSLGEHRPMTLLFVKERSLEGVREALNEGRTAVYYYLPGVRDLLIGNEVWLKAIFEKAFSLKLMDEGVRKGTATVVCKNDLPFILDLKATGNGVKLPETLRIPPGTTRLQVELDGSIPSVTFEVLNFDIAKGRKLNCQIALK